MDFLKHFFDLFNTNKSYKEMIQPEEQPAIKHFDKDSKFYKASLLLAEIKENGKLPIYLSPVVLKSLVVIADSPDWDTKLDDESINNLNKIYEKWQRHIKNSSKNQPIVQLGTAGGFEEPQPEQIEEYETPEPNVIIYEHDLETGEFDLCEDYTSELLKDSSKDVVDELVKIGMGLDENNQLCFSKVDDIINITIKAKKDLLENYSKFSSYEWLKQIAEEDKLNLLKDIYDTFNFPAMPQFFYEKYSKYNKDLIENIYIKEKSRLNIRIKAYYIYEKKHNTQEISNNKQEIWFAIKMPGNMNELTGQGKNLNNYCIEFDYLLYLNLTNDFDCYYSDGSLAVPDILSVENKVSNFPIGLLYMGCDILILNEDDFMYYKNHFNFSLYLDKNK